MATSEKSSSDSSTRKVYRGILQALDRHELVPGQRLIEADFATQFGVGRNAVREALQLLAGRGVVELSSHRSASIRQLDLDQTLEVLEVTEVLVGLLVKKAAMRYESRAHSGMLKAALGALDLAMASGESTEFNQARRGFYRALLDIGGNREMKRLFPAVGMHLIQARYQSARLQRLRHADYHDIADAVMSGDPKRAEQAGRTHTDNVRAAILDQAAV